MMAETIELIPSVEFTLIRAINDRIVITQTDRNGEDQTIDIPWSMTETFIAKVRRVAEAER